MSIDGPNTAETIKLRSTITLLIVTLGVLLAACVGDVSSPGGAGDTQPFTGSGQPVAGGQIYGNACSSCHASDLLGLDGLGNQLAPSEFVATTTERELADYISEGRPANDPDNTMGIEMPPKGGSPWLSDRDMVDVAAYLKASQ